MRLFHRDKKIVDGILEIIKWPSKGAINFIDPRTNLYIGMSGLDVRQQLRDCIVREDQNPQKGIDRIISISSYPQIWRFVISNELLASIIIEYGVIGKFEKVFARLEKKIQEIFAFSVKRYTTEDIDYPTYTWEYSDHYCYLTILLDRSAYLRPWADMIYSDTELEGTFIRKAKTRSGILPTIAIIFCKDKTIEELSIRYLANDLSKRSKATTYIPPFDINQEIF